MKVVIRLERRLASWTEQLDMQERDLYSVTHQLVQLPSGGETSGLAKQPELADWQSATVLDRYNGRL